MPNYDAIGKVLDVNGNLASIREYAKAQKQDPNLPTAHTLMRMHGVERWNGLARVYGLDLRSPRPGRPHLTCGAWAYAQHLLGRPIADYVEDYQRLHRRETGKGLADPYRSIRAAIAIRANAEEV